MLFTLQDSVGCDAKMNIHITNSSPQIPCVLECETISGRGAPLCHPNETFIQFRIVCQYAVSQMIVSDGRNKKWIAVKPRNKVVKIAFRLNKIITKYS